MEKGNLTRRELMFALTDKLGHTQRHAAEIVDVVFKVMKNTLASGESIKLVQFGTLCVRYKSNRRGRNPQTGEAMTITKRRVVTFRPGRRWRERLNRA